MTFVRGFGDICHIRFIFCLMKKEKMRQVAETAVKNAAQSLLKRLREEKPRVIVQDWFRDGQSQGRVKTAVETGQLRSKTQRLKSRATIAKSAFAD